MSEEVVVLRFVIELFLIIALIPVVVIVAPLTVGVVKMILSHQERKAKIRAETSASVSGSLRDEVEALRRELSQLRDTATQYDVSIQHTLEELLRRVEHLESRKTYGPVVIDEEESQTVEARRRGS